MKNDRRHYPRYSVDISCDVTSDTGKTLGVVVEISVDGLRFQAHKSINPDSMVTVSLPEMAISIRGSVIWTVEAVLAGLPAYHMGLKIHALHKGDAEALSFTQRTEVIEDIMIYAKNE